MLICFWSPKGGSGTSVVAAAAALVMAREGSVRLADLSGDQPGIFGVADPATGLRDWLRLGPEAPVDALERVAVDAAPRVSLLPSGTADVAPALPEAGAALAVALAQDARPTVVDAGTLSPGSVPPAPPGRVTGQGDPARIQIYQVLNKSLPNNQVGVPVFLQIFW